MDISKLNEKMIIESSIANNTYRAYESGWKVFEDYCNQKSLSSLPAETNTVCDFLVDQATTKRKEDGNLLSMGTIVLYRCAINHKHRENDLQSPTSHPKISSIIKGLMRIRGNNKNKVKALREDEIVRMIDACENDTIGHRNAAIIALGFAGTMRRSEICSLKFDDICIDPPINGVKRMLITIRKSKTDQNGQGQTIAIMDGKKIKPIQLLQRWLDCSGVSDGYLFQTMLRGGGLRHRPLHPSDIPRIIKNYASKIGLDTQGIAGHSLRSGFVTSAAIHGARLDKIMEVTRHKTS